MAHPKVRPDWSAPEECQSSPDIHNLTLQRKSHCASKVTPRSGRDQMFTSILLMIANKLRVTGAVTAPVYELSVMTARKGTVLTPVIYAPTRNQEVAAHHARARTAVSLLHRGSRHRRRQRCQTRRRRRRRCGPHLPPPLVSREDRSVGSRGTSSTGRGRADWSRPSRNAKRS